MAELTEVHLKTAIQQQALEIPKTVEDELIKPLRETFAEQIREAEKRTADLESTVMESASILEVTRKVHRKRPLKKALSGIGLLLFFAGLPWCLRLKNWRLEYRG